MKKLRLYLRLARLLGAIALGAGFAVVVSLAERLTRRDLMPLRQRLTQRFLAHLADVLPFRVSITGTRPDRPMLWVSNHVSWVDIPLLGGLAPLSFLSKSEVRTWPIAGWLAHKAGTLFIRRGSGDSALLARQLGRHLQGGYPLMIFPEGTTTDGTTLRTFHGRLLTCAIDSGTPLQPVAIRYRQAGHPCTITPFIGDDDLLSHLLRLLASDPIEAQIQLLEPILSVDCSRNELARRAQHAIAATLDPQSTPPLAEAA